jgi:hypothetical protein
LVERIGNPFFIGLGKQKTPLRPRTARDGLSIRFQGKA